MQCPRLHGAMIPIHLSAACASSRQAFFCEECRAVWMKAAECKDYLGIDTELARLKLQHTYIDLSCPQCLTTLQFRRFAGYVVYVCGQCRSCFMDSGVLPCLLDSLKETFLPTDSALPLPNSDKAVPSLTAPSPIDRLGMTCCECDAEIPHPGEAHMGAIGCCCQRCTSTPQLISEQKFQNAQLVTFRSMEVKVDHWRRNSHSVIAVTPAEPCLLNVTLYSLSLPVRMLRFGYRKLALRGKLRRRLDASEGIEFKTPWHVFLKQRGIIECLDELSTMGSICIEFMPHSIIFDLENHSRSVELRHRFEASVRRLLLAYERFVLLTKRYDTPSATSTT
ncbi:MAG: hypothetical protein FWC40_05640 [Proteobacteria bacterium]|nr:hypothetical protein [Pseudomonadota bacterium]